MLTVKNVGKNTIAKFGMDIARELGLENPEEYTGHTYRRSAATEMANNGGSGARMQRFFHWKDQKTANEYIDSSPLVKQQV